MKTIKVIIFICTLTFSLTACGQSKIDRLILGKNYAETELKSALKDTLRYNIVKSGSVIIKDSLTATTIAETILFSIFGKANIKEQRPYETYHIDNYWILIGTLPKGWKGGTFLIIIDDRNSQVIKITHGK